MVAMMSSGKLPPMALTKSMTEPAEQYSMTNQSWPFVWYEPKYLTILSDLQSLRIWISLRNEDTSPVDGTIFTATGYPLSMWVAL